MIILGGMLLLFLLIVFIFAMRGTSEAEKVKEQKQELNILESKIIGKRAKLNSLEQEIQNKAIDRISNLSNVVNEVLDIYEQSNIKIPLDIIEELQHLNLSTDKQVYDYIENQRNHWKLENNKKTYRRL